LSKWKALFFFRILKWRKNKKYALSLDEVHGVSQTVALCGCIEIPQLGTKHSLNISNAQDCSLGFISKMNWPK
jgi:hypothetical protein